MDHLLFLLQGCSRVNYILGNSFFTIVQCLCCNNTTLTVFLFLNLHGGGLEGSRVL